MAFQIAANMADSPTELPRDEPSRGLIPITILFVLVALLSIACGFLWVRSADARLHAEIEARIEIRRAQDLASELRLTAERLREQNQELKALLEAKGHGTAVKPADQAIQQAEENANADRPTVGPVAGVDAAKE